MYFSFSTTHFSVDKLLKHEKGGQKIKDTLVFDFRVRLIVSYKKELVLVVTRYYFYYQHRLLRKIFNCRFDERQILQNICEQGVKVLTSVVVSIRIFAVADDPTQIINLLVVCLFL